MILNEYDFSMHTIQGPIHGAITFGPIEREIIDHRLFQRLHGLRQNSLLYLIFPSANHTRFDHSVGVMWLAEKYLEAIMINQEKICRNGSSRNTFQEQYRVDDDGIKATFKTLSEDKYFRLVIRVAALFHDIGHGPLSHLFDNFFPTGSEIRVLVSGSEYSHINDMLSSYPKKKLEQPIRHEILSCIIATSVLQDCSDTIQDHHLDKTKMITDVCSIIEDGISPSDQLDINAYRVQSLLHDIISSDVDADRMDYLLRDSHMCGVNYGLYDPNRVLKSMCAYARSDTREIHVGVRYSGLGALEDLLISRYQMHSQIYGHKTNRACKVMLDEIQRCLVDAKWKWYEKYMDTIEDFLNCFSDLSDFKFVERLRTDEIDKGAGMVKEMAEKLFVTRKLVKRVYECAFH